MSRAEQSRSSLIDVCKGIAIVLVVLGHNIQYGSGLEFLRSDTYFENSMFKFIYSFHMPLFALISGYLCHIKSDDSKGRFIYRKIYTLFIPVFSWVVFEFFLGVVIKAQSIDSPVQLLKSFFSKLLYSYWFLWAMLFCAIVIWIFEKYLCGNIVIGIMAIILSLFIPDSVNSNLYIFVFPYYMMGYMWQKWRKRIVLSTKWLKRIFLLDSVVFGILLLRYSYNSYIYTTHTYLFGASGWKNQIGIDLYRWIIGFAGSLFVILVCYFSEKRLYICVKNTLIDLGKNTLGIYIVSTLINMYGYKIVYKIAGKYFSPNVIIWIIETVLVLILCLVVCRMIKKSRILSIMFLGGR